MAEFETKVLKVISENRGQNGEIFSVLRVVQYSKDGKTYAPALELRGMFDKDGETKMGKVKGLRLGDLKTILLHQAEIESLLKP